MISMSEKNLQNLLVTNEENPIDNLKPKSSSISEKEIKKLLESPEFLDFVQTIEDSLDDGSTFDSLLSSDKVLGKALEVLKLQSSKR